nr:unnamed protein product [Spirometra erinaceieuropaei]
MSSEEGEDKIVVLGQSEEWENWYMRTYNPDCDDSETLGQMKKCSRTAFVAIKGSVFAIGGRLEGEYCSTRVEEFKVKERQWKPRAPLMAGRDNHAAVSLKIGEQDVILVCGGWNKKDEELRSCELFVSQEDRWHSLPELRDKREGPAAAALPDGRAFVLGGHDGASSITSVEYCHFRPDWQERAVQDTQFWKPVAPMHSPRSCLAAAAFKGKIIVVGGYDDHRSLDSAEVFSPPTDGQSLGQWTEIATMDIFRSPASLFVYENRLIAIGHDGGLETEVEELAPEKSTSGRDVDDLSTWKWVTKRVLTGFNSASGAAARVGPLTLAGWNIRSILDKPRSRRPERRTALIARELACYKADQHVRAVNEHPAHKSMLSDSSGSNAPTARQHQVLSPWPAMFQPPATSTTTPTFIPGLPSPSTTFISVIPGTTSVVTTTTITAPTPARDMDSALTCLYCDRIFTSRIGLVDHLLIHGTATGAPVPGAPTYTCRIRLHCSRTCIRCLDLPGHMCIRISEIRRNVEIPRRPCTPTNPHLQPNQLLIDRRNHHQDHYSGNRLNISQPILLILQPNIHLTHRPGWSPANPSHRAFRTGAWSTNIDEPLHQLLALLLHV